MIEFEGVVGIALLALWIFALVDCIATDASLVRNLPKGLWLVIIFFTADIGSILWLILGRPQHARFSPGSTELRPAGPSMPRRSQGSRGPMNEDSPDFMRQVEQQRLRAWEEDLRRREEDLRRRDDDPPAPHA